MRKENDEIESIHNFPLEALGKLPTYVSSRNNSENL